jgi:hypothetical protein
MIIVGMYGKDTKTILAPMTLSIFSCNCKNQAVYLSCSSKLWRDTFMKVSNVLNPSCGTVFRGCNEALSNLGCDGSYEKWGVYKTVFVMERNLKNNIAVRA